MTPVGLAIAKFIAGKGGTIERLMPWDPEDPWQTLYDRCESHIERKMCLAICSLLGYQAVEESWDGWKPPSIHRSAAFVFGQQPIDRNRVDFLVIGKVVGCPPAKIIVECDGAEFHDPGKDEERDYELSLIGFRTVRFTGKEIYRGLGAKIGRIPLAMGTGIAWQLAADAGSASLSDFVDGEEERRARAADEELDVDGFSGNWKDTL